MCRDDPTPAVEPLIGNHLYGFKLEDILCFGKTNITTVNQIDITTRPLFGPRCNHRDFELLFVDDDANFNIYCKFLGYCVFSLPLPGQQMQHYTQ